MSGRETPTESLWAAIDAHADRLAALAEANAVVVVDSHTEGEPTRVVLRGGPSLPTAEAATRHATFSAEHDEWRRSIIREPRGNDAIVGALIGRPVHPEAIASVIYFNDVGTLPMCVHATIGVVETLAARAGLRPGSYALETSVGIVHATLHEDRRVSVANVESRRVHADVEVDAGSAGKIRGDVAWGGNWFFLARDPEDRIGLDEVPRLTSLSWALRRALVEAGITGSGGAEIDHIHLCGTPSNPDALSRAFVMCPGGAYDRSPCGTGTSAKLACLAARGELAEGEVGRFESVVGSSFTGSYQSAEQGVAPTVSGRAYLTGEGVLLFAADDPFRGGIA